LIIFINTNAIQFDNQGKKKKCIECGKMDYIFSKGRCAQCAKVGNHKALEAKDQEKEDSESVAILKKDADILFSRVVRLRAAAPGTGMLNCYICDAPVHYSQSHAMHFEGREDSGLRYHHKNVRAGCFGCNVTKGGNLELYAVRLEEEEKGLSEWLYLEGKEPYKFWREELKTLIGDLSREVNHLKKVKNLK
jgi:ribosomal protein L37E